MVLAELPIWRGREMTQKQSQAVVLSMEVDRKMLFMTSYKKLGY